MKIEVEYDLTSETVVLRTELSHRAFSVSRQFHCRECGTVNKNALVEALRAYAMYAAKAKSLPKDVSRAILAYDLEEILKALGQSVEAKVHRVPSRRKLADGVYQTKRVERLKIEDLGELE